MWVVIYFFFFGWQTHLEITSPRWTLLGMSQWVNVSWGGVKCQLMVRCYSR